MSLPVKWLDVNVNVWMRKFPLILASLRGNPTNTPPPHSHTVPLLLPVSNQRSSNVCPSFSIALVPLFTTYDKILTKHTSHSAAVTLVKGAMHWDWRPGWMVNSVKGGIRITSNDGSNSDLTKMCADFRRIIGLMWPQLHVKHHYNDVLLLHFYINMINLFKMIELTTNLYPTVKHMTDVFI